jgi:transcriptional regulator with XRE-family HTH domain
MPTPTLPCPRCHGSGHVQDDAAIGAQMRQLREEAGPSLREVARRMGCSAQYVHQLETGDRHWSEERKSLFLSVLK